MGLLRSGNILTWNRLWKTREIIKNKGIDQFIIVYNRNKDNITTVKAFGEELELIAVIKNEGTYKLYCGGEKIIGKAENTSVEYGRYMIEISPKNTYDESTIDKVENGITSSIKGIEEVSEPDVYIIMMPCFPYMHYKNFYDTKPLTSDVTLSLNFPDNAITQHKRFESFTENIRNRRGKKIDGYIEVMEDINLINDNLNKYIHIDSMGQGMGCCGLQVTIQGKTIDEARYVYDMMGALGPVLLRLTRGTPCANGKLLNTETRWEMLEMSVDCRVNDERGSESIYSNVDNEYEYSQKIPKSRFSPFDLFISNDKRNLDNYNDTNPPIHNPIYSKLIKNGIDHKLSMHIASLFIRDPVVSYEETNEQTFDDFENIQSSNWRSVRFKIPIERMPKDLRGWKVEVRPMEIQATAFENAAFIYLVYLTIQAILEYDLNFYIPISLVDANFFNANRFIRKSSDYQSKLQEDDQKFFYRKNITDANEAEVCEGTVKDIFLGTEESQGILHFVYKIIDDKYSAHSEFLKKYINFIEDKINNKYLSLSDYIRKFVITHPDYKNDSVLSDVILNELIENMVKIRQNNNTDYLKNE
ncbi:glutamate-cysteine ligase [Vairimorpha necatrix]|uniref:Glutamate--cysteine ligase n=1 Tax=Vairimorpha necatrix TaxID=6039 RepID=A0AAX4JFN8_9MICR